MSATRRYELDWLRVIAFMVLIYFHAAIFFVPFGLPLIQNAENSGALEIFVHISSQFRLALLFFISGAGVYFARRQRSEREFVLERSQRLLIPLVIGIVLIVPPMVYTEKLFLGSFSGSLLEFYPLVFTTGVYPQGNLSWHHFWFIAYLYIFCLLAIGPFRWLAGKGADWLAWFDGKGVYLFILVLLVPEWLLRWSFPGFRDLIHDWASFSLWFLVFVAGFAVASRVSLIDDIVRLRRVSLMLAVVMTLIMFAIWGDLTPALTDDDVLAYFLWCVLRITMVWCSILTCLGFAGRYLRTGGPVLQYMTEAVYPLFILHLTTLVVLGYFIIPTDWSIWTKYLVLTSATIVMILGFYQFAIRPFDRMRILFGVRPKSPSVPLASRTAV